MGLYKRCRCGKRIDYNQRYCEDCMKQEQEEKKRKTRYYDRYKRDKESKAIYEDKRWKRLTKQCERRFVGMDIYQYYKYGIVTSGMLSHHIIEVKEDKERAFDLDNLIYLNEESHAEIHSIYDKSDRDKRQLQEFLFDLVYKFMNEFID